jgi:hypothetical protein
LLASSSIFLLSSLITRLKLLSSAESSPYTILMLSRQALNTQIYRIFKSPFQSWQKNIQISRPASFPVESTSWHAKELIENMYLDRKFALTIECIKQTWSLSITVHSENKQTNTAMNYVHWSPTEIKVHARST